MTTDYIVHRYFPTFYLCKCFDICIYMYIYDKTMYQQLSTNFVSLAYTCIYFSIIKLYYYN